MNSTNLSTWAALALRGAVTIGALLALFSLLGILR
jgi:hypothetical protein